MVSETKNQSINEFPNNIQSVISFHLPIFPHQAALNMLSCCFAEELKGHKILVMAIHPGWVQTDMGGDKVSCSPLKCIHWTLAFIPEQMITGCTIAITI